MTSHGLTDAFRDYLVESGAAGEADEPYDIRHGRQLNFRHKTDLSVGFYEPHGSHSNHIKNGQKACFLPALRFALSLQPGRTRFSTRKTR